MKDKPIPISDEFSDALYEQRILVFIEVDPLSNKYRQVILTNAQYKAMGTAVGKNTGKKCNSGRHEVWEIEESDEEYTLADLQPYLRGKLSTPKD